MTACRDAPELANADLAPGLAERALDAVVRAATEMRALDLDARAMMALERATLGEPVARGELLDALDAAYQAAVRMTSVLIAAPTPR